MHGNRSYSRNTEGCNFTPLTLGGFKFRLTIGRPHILLLQTIIVVKVYDKTGNKKPEMTVIKREILIADKFACKGISNAKPTFLRSHAVTQWK